MAAVVVVVAAVAQTQVEENLDVACLTSSNQLWESMQLVGMQGMM